MCGIAGMIHKYKTMDEQRACAERIIRRMKHRGPDDDGIYCREGVMLCHMRLAVVDIENGVQPMICGKGENEYALVYNGELYNTAELRQELEVLGYEFKGHSDTEVVLKAYVQWGEKCLDRFNGIFAFAVWDNAKHKLFCARDRMGVKPFFFAQAGGGFFFASEIKGLFCFDEITPKLDSTSIAEIMLIGPARTPGTGVLRGIRELRAGECAVFENDTLTVRRYYDIYPRKHLDSEKETIEKVRFLVTDAIKRQTVSDVPLCCFLSGGLDSSAISAVTAREMNVPLKTFSVEYRDNEKYFTPSKFQPNSDDCYIKIMSDFLGSEHHRIVVDSPQLFDALFAAVDARDLPGMADVDSSLLLFCREVKKHCTVALSGECADEIFGGYPWYRDKEIRMTDGFPWSQSTTYRFSLLKDGILGGINPEKYVHDKYLLSTSKVTEGGSPLEHRMKEMMRLNLDWFMQVLLDRKDRMSMACGLEVRVPFCDHRIVEYLYNVPWELKDYKHREKGILRKALEGLLPDEIIRRKKSPYPKTHNPSYEKLCRDYLLDICGTPASPLWDILDKSRVTELLTENPQIQWYGQLMNYPQIMAYLIQLNYFLASIRPHLILAE